MVIDSLETLKRICEETGMHYTFGVVKETPNPPLLISKIISENNIIADNRIYATISKTVELALLTPEKDISKEKMIEQTVLKDTPYTKEEEYIVNTEMYAVYYKFDIQNF